MMKEMKERRIIVRRVGEERRKRRCLVSLSAEFCLDDKELKETVCTYPVEITEPPLTLRFILFNHKMGLDLQNMCML